ncbi:MAG TPA: phosphatase PAP2 family protein [Hymenobacter sp.]|jgi:undecaprenyl-diphosphatase|uniref:phosphatase PAP2 family protein n=1 Tax=Hymenobacter sp. TaxID=1898978 RepID=UPI002EDAB88B
MTKPPSRFAALAGLLTLEVVGAVVAFVMAFSAFFYLAREVFGQPTVLLDQQAFAVADRWRAAFPMLTGIVQAITFFGSIKFFFPASLIAPWWMRRYGYGRQALTLLIAMGGGWALNELLKAWFHRPRPTSALLFQMGLSFPSGHAMMSIAFYGCLAWLVGREYGRWGWSAVLMLWALLIGLTRVYLHVHYFTDVLAGFAGGVGWLLLLRAGLKIFLKEEQEMEEEGGGPT